MSPQEIIFLAVDVQADFMLPGGKLYVPGAEKIIPKIERLVNAAIESGLLLVSSGDSHPEGDPEFSTFPPHCLRGSAGARIVPEGPAKHHFTMPNDATRELPNHVPTLPQVVFEKQTLSVFDNSHAGVLVERLPADAEYVVFGVVTEHGVKCAAKGLLERGRKVSIVQDAIESLDLEAGRRALDELRRRGARLITTEQALAIIGRRAPHNAVREPAAH